MNQQQNEKYYFFKESFPEISKVENQIKVTDKFKNTQGQNLKVTICSQNKTIQISKEDGNDDGKPNQQNAEEQNKNNVLINQEDLIGATLGMDKENKLTLKIITLVKKKQGCSSKLMRTEISHELCNTDREKIEIWKNIIRHFTKHPNFLEENYEKLYNKELDRFEEKLLCFINPVSGPGKSMQIWQKSKKLLQYAGYEIKEVMTQKRNHAADYITELSSENLFQYSGILSVSGDGLPHEIINALASRPDGEKAMQIGVGPLPGGSANALSKNISDRSDEEVGVVGVTYNIIKGDKMKMDIMELQLDDQVKKIYSFLSVTHAFVADLDINSEFMRFLGEFRFDLYGFYRCLNQKVYPAKVYTKIGESDLNPLTIKEKKELVQNTEQPLQKDEQEEEKTQQNNDQSDDKLINLGKKDIQQQVEINKENWELIQGNFKYLGFYNVPYISENVYQSPLCKVDDGFVELQALCDASWYSLFSTALNMGSGANFDIKNKKPKRDDLRYLFATQFMIETARKKSLFSIDGEKFQCQNIKGKILPKYLSIFCKDKKGQL